MGSYIKKKKHLLYPLYESINPSPEEDYRFNATLKPSYKQLNAYYASRIALALYVYALPTLEITQLFIAVLLGTLSQHPFAL